MRVYKDAHGTDGGDRENEWIRNDKIAMVLHYNLLLGEIHNHVGIVRKVLVSPENASGTFKKWAHSSALEALARLHRIIKYIRLHK